MAKKNSDARARFAHRLRAIRIPRGYKTARSFAVALDIDENRYTRYERAEVEPDFQLLMRICGLLDATPNDLLCDTIGTQPIDMATPYGFAERSTGSYQAMAQPQQEPLENRADTLGKARKVAGWELATLVALLEASADGLAPDALPQLEKLRRIAPIHARIEADAFAFLRELPERLNGIDVPSEMEERIGQLTQEIISTMKPGANDNS